jgi:hypothetical protein
VTSTIRVRVVDLGGLRAWRASVPRSPGGNPCTEDKNHIAATAETVLRWQEPQAAGPGKGLIRFTWVCPGCGGTVLGHLGDQPSGGWDAPRWVNVGSWEKPTLTPSLACPLWRSRRCQGHWHLREGILHPA